MSDSSDTPEPAAPDADAIAGDHPYTVETHARIGSTNDRARELAAAGERDVVVVAAAQTAGRGRRERSWVGPEGGLYLSVVVTPPTPPAAYPLATLAAGVAVVRAVETLTSMDHPPRVKWPNDVLVGEYKLAGVLTERVDDAVVVGVGLNVTTDPADLPERATTLADAAGDATPDRDALARELLVQFATLIAEPDGVLPAWRAVADTLGRRVRVETPGGAVVGEAVDVASPGRLVVRTDDGEVRVDAGDCEHLRPAE